MRFTSVQDLLDFTQIDPKLCAVDTTREACFADHAHHTADLLMRLGYAGDPILSLVAMSVGVAAEHDSREAQGWGGISAIRCAVMTGLSVAETAVALDLLLKLGIVNLGFPSTACGATYRYPEA